MDDYTQFDDELDPGGYDAGGYEGDGSPGLPEGHWAHDQEWLQWMDQFAAQLHADEALLEKFNEFLGSMGGEHGEHGKAAVQPEGGQEAAKFSRLTDPALRQHVLGLFKQEREANR